MSRHAPGLAPISMIDEELRCMMDVADASPEVIHVSLSTEVEPAAQEVYMTIAERLREQGRREGMLSASSLDERF